MDESQKLSSGYIQLHRTLLNSSFASRPAYQSTWIYLLLTASHKPFRTILGGKSVTLNRGQLIGGRTKLANAIGVTEKQIRIILDFFENEGMISREQTNNGSIITIKNYDIYQDFGASLGPALLGQQKGQLEATDDVGCSDIGASTRASKGPAKRATIQ